MADLTAGVELTRLDPAMVRRRWSVVLERTVRELQGMACIPLELAIASKQEIACTRSFGPPVSALSDPETEITPRIQAGPWGKAMPKSAGATSVNLLKRRVWLYRDETRRDHRPAQF